MHLTINTYTRDLSKICIYICKPPYIHTQYKTYIHSTKMSESCCTKRFESDLFRTRRIWRELQTHLFRTRRIWRELRTRFVSVPQYVGVHPARAPDIYMYVCMYVYMHGLSLCACLSDLSLCACLSDLSLCACLSDLSLCACLSGYLYM